jgi:hypothetical protein
MAAKSVLIHLSDLECGQNNRGESETRTQGYRESTERLISDVRSVLRRRAADKCPRGLVVSGDIADRGLEPEYDKALSVLETLRDALGISRNRIGIVPGNHDVDWPSTARAFAEQWPGLSPLDPKDRERARVLPQKLANFGSFFTRLTGLAYDGPESVLAFDGFTELGVALIGLDSTYPCTFCPEDNYGLLRDVSCNAAQARLAPLLRNPQLVPIALVHHCPNPLADIQEGDASYLHNASEGLGWLRHAGFSVILCGHEHRQRSSSDLRTQYQVLATGSYGLNRSELLRVNRSADRVETNRYQLILLDPEGQSEFMLRKLQWPGMVESDWIDDDDDGPSEFPVHLRRPLLESELQGSGFAEVAAMMGRPCVLLTGSLVMSVSLVGPRAALASIRSVSYEIGAHRRTTTNKGERFGAMLEFHREEATLLWVQLTLNDGTEQRTKYRVPEAVG